MAEFKLPTETVELPSKGLLYPADSPLASGTIEMKYMTAKEEDILSNSNYLANGTAIDKLLQSLIVTEGVDFNDLLLGDKNAVMIAARIVSYGKNYSFTYRGEQVTVDLSSLNMKPIDEELLQNSNNDFTFKLPSSGNEVNFKILRHSDEKAIEKEIEGLKKINNQENYSSSTRLKYIITGVNGIRESSDIRNFVDNYLLARDARELRKYYGSLSPDIDLKTKVKLGNGVEEDVEIPITLAFFWPDI